MPQAFTIISARFARDLTADDDQSAAPTGATMSMAGSEVDWAETGMPSRRRTVRTWIAVWPDRDLARSYLDRRFEHIPLLAQAEEHWCGLMLPYQSHGDLNWLPEGTSTAVFDNLGPRPKPARPVFVMTTLGIGNPGEGMIAFGKGTRAVRQAFADLPAVILEQQLLPDVQGLDAPTLTLWENEAEVIGAAYRSEPHRSAMKVADHPDLARGSFTRMTLLWAEGSWEGVNLRSKGAIGPKSD
ncbi:MAG: hypothetical protein VX874_04665 [Pseudomonadota bacterium]|nr:hypothetical protein [Pseudomonadota bacterium]